MECCKGIQVSPKLRVLASRILPQTLHSADFSAFSATRKKVQNSAKCKVWARFLREVPSFLEIPEFLYITVYYGWGEPLCRKPAGSIRSAISTERRLVTDSQTDTGPRHIPRCAYASRGKKQCKCRYTLSYVCRVFIVTIIRPHRSVRPIIADE